MTPADLEKLARFVGAPDPIPGLLGAVPPGVAAGLVSAVQRLALGETVEQITRAVAPDPIGVIDRVDQESGG